MQEVDSHGSDDEINISMGERTLLLMPPPPPLLLISSLPLLLLLLLTNYRNYNLNNDSDEVHVRFAHRCPFRRLSPALFRIALCYPS